MKHIIIIFVILIRVTSAFGFAEDLCLSQTGGYINCIQVSGCTPQTENSASCRAAAANQMANGVAVRSSVHTDAVYFLAQAVGLSPEVAYWMAAYSEATDLGYYVPSGVNGALLSDPQYQTISIIGWNRTNFLSGGTIAHFPIHLSSGQVDGLHPDLEDPKNEVTLYRLRQWGLYHSLSSCVGGFSAYDSKTNSYGAGASCYQDQLQASLSSGSLNQVPKYLNATMPVLSWPNGQTLLNIPFQAYSGSSFFDDQAKNQTVTSALFDNTDFEMALQQGTGKLAKNPVPVAIPRFAIYLHVLFDRISHHRCLDNSPAVGPAVNGTFTLNYSSSYCAAGWHAYLHYEEVGFSPLSDRTTSALQAGYNELLEFAALHPEFRVPGAIVLSNEEAVSAVTGPLQTSNALSRVQAFINVNSKYNFAQMPGN